MPLAGRRRGGEVAFLAGTMSRRPSWMSLDRDASQPPVRVLPRPGGADAAVPRGTASAVPYGVGHEGGAAVSGDDAHRAQGVEGVSLPVMPSGADGALTSPAPTKLSLPSSLVGVKRPAAAPGSPRDKMKRVREPRIPRAAAADPGAAGAQADEVLPAPAPTAQTALPASSGVEVSDSDSSCVFVAGASAPVGTCGYNVVGHVLPTCDARRSGWEVGRKAALSAVQASLDALKSGLTATSEVDVLAEIVDKKDATLDTIEKLLASNQEVIKVITEYSAKLPVLPVVAVGGGALASVAAAGESSAPEMGGGAARGQVAIGGGAPVPLDEMPVVYPQRVEPAPWAAAFEGRCSLLVVIMGDCSPSEACFFRRRGAVVCSFNLTVALCLLPSSCVP